MSFASLALVLSRTMSPDRAVFVNDLLVAVKLLIDGTTAVQMKRPRLPTTAPNFCGMT